jgi:hypothetical protein
LKSSVDDDAVKEIKMQWKSLWQERFDDKVKAEGIANNDYSLLFVERGTVLFATRNFRPLDLKDILERNRLADAQRIVPPSPTVGGWSKFIRTLITGQVRSTRERRAIHYSIPERQRQQLKKGGRGWLHK